MLSAAARREQGERLLALCWKPAAVARHLEVSRTTVWRWQRARRLRDGTSGPRRGRPSKLTDEQKREVVWVIGEYKVLYGLKLAAELHPELSYRKRLCEWIWKNFGARYTEAGAVLLIKTIISDPAMYRETAADRARYVGQAR